ncbi:Sorting and assembly machinery component 50-like protein A [Triticum urartu]|uniref:Sorting and assembly machinery component 50-like protein A n=1 Tax=Triticum urartu TaxID=4572 RepID=M7YI92_TRIUA|nr:Sorting and assembly machinery component 50-like protein A [Triticum urartu]
MADPAAVQNRVPEPWAGADGEIAEEEYEEEEEEELDERAAAALEREKVQSVFRRLSSDLVGIRVHDVIIRGNAKTREELIEAEVADLLRSTTTVQDLLSAAADASARLRGLDVFEAVNITLDAGPPELPGTTNVIIEVVEPAIPISGNAGVFSKPEAKAWSLEGAVKWKNLAGYADIWDASVAYGWDQTTEEFDVRGALPFGFWNAALNVGVGAGVVLPLARGFMNSSTPVTDRFNLGGHSSPVCSLGGISSLLGFRTRGVGPTEARRLVPGESEDGSAAVPGRDYLGGDLAVSAFADLSFDLPLKVFRDAGIHGHAFLTAGNLVKLSEGQYKNFSLDEFRRSFRSSAGVGIILPTKLFRVEVNYCYILKQSQHDSGKTGIQFSFSSPS